MLPGKEAAEACLRNVIRGGCGKVSLYAPSGHQVHGIMTPPPHHLPGLASLPVNTDTAKTHLDSSSIFSENMVMLLQLRHNDLTLIPVEHGISLQKRPYSRVVVALRCGSPFVHTDHSEVAEYLLHMHALSYS